MATLTIIHTDHDTQRTITSIADLKAALPAVPALPATYILQLDNQSIQIWYGDPDRDHHQVKSIRAHGIDRHHFETVREATDAFLRLARVAL